MSSFITSTEPIRADTRFLTVEVTRINRTEGGTCPLLAFGTVNERFTLKMKKLKRPSFFRDAQRKSV